jgi:hypothetical protein
VQCLPPAEFRLWVNTLLAAGRCDGRLPGIAELSFMLRSEAAKLAKALENLIDRTDRSR